MTSATAPIGRAGLPFARRIVVKVGSSSLTNDDGFLDVDKLRAIVRVLAERRSAGTEIVLVSSGAQAAGMGPLALAKRPRDLATAQAAASVGQGILIARYSEAFITRGLRVGQVLLTAEDVIRRSHYRNAHRTLARLLALGVVPIVNENDTVATSEIRFGDNDRLAALVAHLVHAEALVLLTDVDALYTGPPTEPGSLPIAVVDAPGRLSDVRITSEGSAVGTGGMASKVSAAHLAADTGIPTLITSAERAGAVFGVGERADFGVGTWFLPTGSRVPIKRLWLAHAADVRGRVIVDDGAAAAVRERGKSLLLAGVTGVLGQFEAGEPIEIATQDGTVFARGLAGYSALEVPSLMGRSSAELAATEGQRSDPEMTHRDELVLLPSTRSARGPGGSHRGGETVTDVGAAT